MDRHVLETTDLKVAIKAYGAELCSLQDTIGTELLWQAGVPWHRHAPNLFPIVGQLKDNLLHHEGQSYQMKQHGFARDMTFAWAEKTATSCRLVLRDDAATRSMYPFAFQLAISYELTDDTLSVTYKVENTGETVLPAALGAHPGFIWPLAPGIPKDIHTLVFAQPETTPVRRIADGLLMSETFPTPVEGTVLPLNDALFANDAVIMDHPASRSVVYSAPGAHAITVSWDEGFPNLGIWARADAELLCIEPWHGMASPATFDGDFIGKPGVMLIPPGQSRTARYTIQVQNPIRKGDIVS